MRTTHLRGLASACGVALALLLLAAPPAAARSANLTPHFAVALLGFETEDPALEDSAVQLAELVTADLSSKPGLILVERERLDAALSELELGLSGLTQPGTAARVGQLVGARALVMGRLFFVGEELTATSRVIGTETSRVFVTRASLPAGRSVGELASQVAEKLAASVIEHRSDLVGANGESASPVERLAKLTAGKQLPSVSIAIEEQHAGRPALDPAAATELASILSRLGFRVVEAGQPHAAVDVRITGEAISEEGMHKGNLVSASGRVEIQATDARSHEVITSDRRTQVAVDLSGRIAGKKALQQASAQLSEGLVVALLRR